MKDYYANTRNIMDKYNQIVNKVHNGSDETSLDEDEFLQNFCIHFAHALIKDIGYDGRDREELCKIADIILAVLR